MGLPVALVLASSGVIFHAGLCGRGLFEQIPTAFGVGFQGENAIHLALDAAFLRHRTGNRVDKYRFNVNRAKIIDVIFQRNFDFPGDSPFRIAIFSAFL